VCGKIIGCTTGAFLSGQKGRTSLQIGMGMAQIGEFSFIIAALGSKMNVISSALYPIAISVSAITTLSTPYLIKAANPLAHKISQVAPKNILNLIRRYTIWLARIRPSGDQALIVHIIAKISLQILVNCTLVAAVFIAGAFIFSHVDAGIWRVTTNMSASEQVHRSIICGGALLISLPFIIAAYRKLKALGMIFAEIMISTELGGKYTYQLRRVIFEFIPLVAIFAIMSLIFSLSAHIVPDVQWLALLVIVMIILAALLWGPMVKIQSWLQIRLFEVMEEKSEIN
jgi:CPA2 family monovalent cation:H+ antiporter-2